MNLVYRVSALAAATLSIALTAGASPAPTQAPAAYVTSVPGALRVELSADRAIYHVGDPVRLRIILQNVSNVPLSHHLNGPANDFVLNVLDASGARIEPHGLLSLNVVSGHPAILSPGVRLVETATRHGDDYRPISDWGYALTRPSTYSIRAKLKATSIASNAISIVVH